MEEQNWNALWISVRAVEQRVNQWLCFRRSLNLPTVPEQMSVRIAVDSKYWLWINGQLVVHEGQLKRGPTPQDTYYDELDLAPHLCAGENQVSVLLWYFGKEGFCHKSSGVGALLFDSDGLVSDSS